MSSRNVLIIKEGLLQGLDVSIYTELEINAYRKKQILRKLQEEQNLSLQNKGVIDEKQENSNNTIRKTSFFN